MSSLLQRYASEIKGLLSCWDRVVIHGTLPRICYAKGMTSYLYAHNVRIFDYARWAEPLRNELRANSEALAHQHGVEIEFVRKSKFRKEARIRKVLDKRGTHPGLVHILSAMEGCPSYKPWHDKKTGKTFLKPTRAQCLHYYFYFIDEELGLCYVRVPTWCPFRLQIYFNGHNYLAAELDKAGISYRLLDNAFVELEDFEQAQRLADAFDVRRLHAKLDHYASLFCPVIAGLGERYHWSLMQVEYATDIVFKQQRDLGALYETLIRTAVHAVKPNNVATFLGRKLHGNFKDELGNDFGTRIHGTRIKHHMGPASIKMYDKHGLVLRIEATANDVSFFKHHRTVEHRDGTTSFKLAPVRKTIYSLHDLRSLLAASNRRYLDFISALDDPTSGIKTLQKLTETCAHQGRNYKGFSFLSVEEQSLFQALLRGEHTISGFRNRDLRRCLDGRTSGQISRTLKRLRVHGLIKRVARTYKYYLTVMGRRVATAALKLRELVLIPQLARDPTC